MKNRRMSLFDPLLSRMRLPLSTSISASIGALCLLLSVAGPVVADDFLPVDDAFKLTATPSTKGGADIHFTMAKGYHLYRERITISSPILKVAPVEMPKGRVVYDPNLEQDMEIYDDTLNLAAKFSSAKVAEAPLQVDYQGCAEAGLCYPPQTRELKVQFGDQGKIVAITPVAVTDDAPALAAAPPAASATPAVATSSATPEAAVLKVSTNAVPTVSATAATESESSSTGGVEGALKSGHLFKIAGVFLVAGLLLSLTPCVLPMVPILSSIIVGQTGVVSRRRGFMLALSYSLGMAMVYTLFGIAAGLLGEGLAAWLQNPWVLGAFGSLLVLLALSMFGVYELQLPAAMQTRVTMAANGLPGGRSFSVFLMGGLSALIVGPCVAGPLAGALIFISQTHDVVIGGTALFSLASGMSVPLLLVGLSAGSLLPRTGKWMESVKTVFGVMLLGVAWWLVSPVLPPAASLMLVAVLLALTAALLGAFNTLDAKAGFGSRAAKAGGLLLASIAIMQVIGAMSGATQPWQPLAPLAQRAVLSGPVAATSSGPSFRRVKGLDGLQTALGDARGRKVMVDLYADWCVACKELEHETFSDPKVQQHLSNLVLLQVDVTANTPADRAFMKHYGLFGPPAVLFFDGEGQEAAAARVIGFQAADKFVEVLQQVIR
jgi:thiol:disulfide interchange protein DsbD